MRGTRTKNVSIVFALVFAAISSTARFARAQSKQELRIYGGGELGGGAGGEEGTPDIGASLGVAYAPIRFLSFGIVGSYALLPAGSCEILLSGDAGYECPKFHPYRLTTEIEIDPFEREVVQPFFVAVGGVFGEHDTLTGQDPKVVPTFGGGGGLHFFPVAFLSVDVAVRVMYADFSDYQFGKIWAIFSVGATPRISF